MADFEMVRGDTKYFDLEIIKNGLPVDLTGGKIWLSGVRNLGDSSYVFQKHSDNNGIDITDPSGGLATAVLIPSDTSSLPSEVVTVHYDVQIKELDGTISTVQTGTLTISPDVTLETV